MAGYKTEVLPEPANDAVGNGINMKITSVEFKNYKSFLDAKADFHEYVNVVVGSSDSGKSAIVHGINLVANNTPRNQSYRTKRTDKTVVTVCTKDSSVSRIKTDKLNQYIVKSNDKIIAKPKAIKTDIPSSVKKALGLSESNFQLQRNHFFLLDISPGKRAKILNKVANLSAVDNSIKAITTEIKKLKVRTVLLLEDEKELSSFLIDTAWVDEADAKLLEIEKLQESIDADETRIDEINYINNQLLEEKRQLDSLLPDDAVLEIKKIYALYADIDKEKSILDTISLKYDSLIILEKEYSQIEVVSTEELLKSIRMIELEETRLSRIQSIMKDLNTFQINAVDCDKKLSEIVSTLSKMKICPTCGSAL